MAKQHTPLHLHPPPYSAREPSTLTPMIEDGNEETRLQPPAASLRRPLCPNERNFR